MRYILFIIKYHAYREEILRSMQENNLKKDFRKNTFMINKRNFMNDNPKNKQGTLKEEMIFQKTRTTNLADVRTLNMWGYELEDISIVSNLVNAETISLPINKITTLYPFQGCRNLKNLLLRQNNISDINEIQYLACLPYLKNLSLAENPITSMPSYRETVISTLPQLEKLDDLDVTAKPPPMKHQQPSKQQQYQPSFPDQPPQKQPQYQPTYQDQQFFPDDNDNTNYGNANRRRNHNDANNNFGEVVPVKKHFNILNNIDYPQPPQSSRIMEKNQPRQKNTNSHNQPKQPNDNNANMNRFQNVRSPTNALDEHLLTAVLSLIPEMSPEALQIVLEAIRDRCKAKGVSV